TRHTTLALADLAEYLLVSENFYYVLLAMFQSDPLEKRFGWYRQLSARNYFVSVRQILEAEKKIRILSLVKFSKMNISEVKNMLTDDSITIAELFLLIGVLVIWRRSPLKERAMLYITLLDIIAFSLSKRYNVTIARNF
ncbi:Putative LOC101234561, partial [Caligus rogercresseyi]